MRSESIDTVPPAGDGPSATSVGLTAAMSYALVGSSKVSCSEAIGFTAVSITEATFSDAAPPCMRSARIVVKRLRLNLRASPWGVMPGAAFGYRIASAASRSYSLLYLLPSCVRSALNGTVTVVFDPETLAVPLCG